MAASNTFTVKAGVRGAYRVHEWTYATWEQAAQRAAAWASDAYSHWAVVYDDSDNVVTSYLNRTYEM